MRRHFTAEEVAETMLPGLLEGMPA